MKKNRFFSILFSLVIVLGLMPGMSLTAYADDPYASIKNTTTAIKFDGEDRYLMLPELALPVYANSEAQESTGDASEERTFVSVTSTGVSTVYDDQLHSGTVVVKTGELNKAYTVYYNTNDVPLTEENYGSYGSPDVPAFKDAGEHTVYYLAVSEGYKPQGGSYTVSIKKAPLSVKAPDAELVYGDSPAEAALNDLSTELSALTITGLKGEDTAAEALNGTPAYHTAYAQYGDVGAYDITLSGLSSSNYELTLLPGTLKVLPKEVLFYLDRGNELRI